MGNKDDRTKDTERTSGLVKGVVVGAAGIGTAIVGAPVVAAAGVGVLASWVHDVTRDLITGRREKRTEAFFRKLLTGEGSMTDEQCKEALEKEPLSSEIITRVLEDEEDGKVWAYVGLFRAFASDHIPKQHRIRFLRCAGELTNAELLAMRGWQKSSKSLVKGPYVLFRITLKEQYREWFIQPELMQEENPHVIEVLSRWGFISRIHERAKQAKLPDSAMPDLRTDEYPVPGKFRLQVNPSLALLLFVFASLTHGDGLQLGRAKKLSTQEEGRVDAIDFKGERTENLDDMDAPSAKSTYRQTLPAPTVDEFKYTVKTQLRMVSATLESLPTDPQGAVRELKRLGNAMSGLRTTGLSQEDFAEAAKKAGPQGSTVTIRGKTVQVAPNVTINAPKPK